MADNEEIYRIIARVEGEDKVRALKAAIDQEEASLNALIQSLKASGNAHFQANAGVQAHAQTIQQLNGDLKAAQAQVATAGGGLGKWSQALSQAGYAADDLQY